MWANGDSGHSEWIGKLDGEDYPLDPNENHVDQPAKRFEPFHYLVMHSADTMAMTRRTFSCIEVLERMYKLNGKEVDRGAFTITDSGLMMISTHSRGNRIGEVLVFYKANIAPK